MKLSDHFLEELLKLLLIGNKGLLGICRNFLKFSYIPTELIGYRYVYKTILTEFELTGNIPTYGYISQKFNGRKESEDVEDALTSIKNSQVAELENILSQLNEYIIHTKSKLALQESVDLFNQGKLEEAVSRMVANSEEIGSFSLKSAQGQFMKVFNDFHSQMEQRSLESEEINQYSDKVPFGILPLDMLTGGIDITDTVLWIMRSGVGKSTALKWTGMYAARLGFDVLHIQLEGSKKEAFDKYTQIWTGTTYNEVKYGDIPSERMVKIDKQLEKLKRFDRELFVYSFEQFGDVTCVDVRELIIEYQKIKGKFPDLVIVDSWDLLYPGDGNKYGMDPYAQKMRYQNSAKLLKNIATELKTRILTATQTGDVPFAIWNDPDKVLTRSDAMGDKNAANQFSYVFTGNQTIDEMKKKTMRINCDKLRNYSVADGVYPIATDYEYGNFFDIKRTKKLFREVYAEN